MQLPNSYPIYFQRKIYLPFILISIVIISGFITYYSFKVYNVYHIYSAFVFAISLLYLSWIYFNPFCIIDETHFEINNGLFSQKKFVYRDIQKVETNSDKTKLILIFNDYDTAEISIRQIKNKDKEMLVELIKIHIYKDLLERDE